jgi:hypothetical protein
MPFLSDRKKIWLTQIWLTANLAYGKSGLLQLCLPADLAYGKSVHHGKSVHYEAICGSPALEIIRAIVEP